MRRVAKTYTTGLLMTGRWHRKREPCYASPAKIRPAAGSYVPASNAKPPLGSTGRNSSRPSNPNATPRWPPLVPRTRACTCPCLLAVSAPRRGRPGRPPLPWTEELGSSPGSLWFLATAPHGSRRRRAAEGAKNAAEVRSRRADAKPRTRPHAHAPGAWHHQPACRGPTCLTRAGESDLGTRRRVPCPCRGCQGLGRRASEAAKWRPVCAASWLPGHWGLHARGGGTRAGRRRAGRLPTCMRNHVRARADAAAWPCRAPKGRGAPAGLRAQCARI
ncbi:hypothetical protein PVAP13_6KG411706 [Panicum virgatum]|uniref:Uncharacterized protein n=1 Tax=Panicum virgatum TaxID=38727 RepID=A0A8T0RID8_PANVG|nr:hypothetical protein PVAP13_6KG411706 [Panicum virgatum]